MKYYDENQSGKLRLALEREIMNWEDVSTKIMFGCPCYLVNEKLFVMMVTNGIVLTSLNEKDKKSIEEEFRTEYFKAGKRTVKKWIMVPLNEETELKPIIPYIRMSFNTAS
jgi:hypothetical protein